MTRSQWCRRWASECAAAAAAPGLPRSEARHHAAWAARFTALAVRFEGET